MLWLCHSFLCSLQLTGQFTAFRSVYSLPCFCTRHVCTAIHGLWHLGPKNPWGPSGLHYIIILVSHHQPSCILHTSFSPLCSYEAVPPFDPALFHSSVTKLRSTHCPCSSSSSSSGVLAFARYAHVWYCLPVLLGLGFRPVCLSFFVVFCCSCIFAQAHGQKGAALCCTKVQWCWCGVHVHGAVRLETATSGRADFARHHQDVWVWLAHC
jgi:hypothetical protein